jgi:hypothetical protein
MKIVNQQMCQLVGGTRESFTWIAHISDPQISARILEKFMATKQPEDVRIIQGRPDLYSIPLIKVMGIDNKEQTHLTKQQRSLAYVFFDWKRMACGHPRIQRNLINELHEQIQYMKRFRTVPYRQLPDVFNSYTLQELEELIYEIYVTAIVTASGRFMPMGIERLKRWLSNMHILTRLGYPPKRLTELLARLVSSYVKREQAWRRENPQKEERDYAHPLIQRLAEVDIKEEKELEDWKEESSSGEDWD